MLVLSRKLRECIQIGANIRITVMQIKPGVVRIGVDAPRDVIITRTELPPKGETEPCTIAGLRTA